MIFGIIILAIKNIQEDICALESLKK